MANKYNGTVLITGGTLGLGYECASIVAQQRPDYKVVIASRSDGNGAAQTINQSLGQANVEFLSLDLSSLINIRDFAAKWQTLRFPPIKALVLNAVLQFPGEIQYSEDGFEKTFAISHIGHALLFFLMRPHMEDTARVVITSSGTHDPKQRTGMPLARYESAEMLAHPTGKSLQEHGRQRYTSTKLANVLYAYSLHRRFQNINARHGKQWTVTAMCPGLMPGTGLAREAGTVAHWLFLHVFPRIIPFLRLLTPNVHTPRESGRALARLAIGEEVEGMSGVYYEGMREIKSSDDSYDEAKQEDLWHWTVKTLGQTEEERKLFDLADLA